MNKDNEPDMMPFTKPIMEQAVKRAEVAAQPRQSDGEDDMMPPSFYKDPVSDSQTIAARAAKKK